MIKTEVDAYNIFKIEPIVLSNEEQCDLVDLINEETKIKQCAQYYIDKLDGKPISEERKKWLKEIKENDPGIFESYEGLSLQELRTIRDAANFDHDSNFNKLYASIILMIYKVHSKSYKQFLHSENKAILISNTIAEIFKALPRFDRTKANFSTYITLYILQGGNQTAAQLYGSSPRNNYLRKQVWSTRDSLIEAGREATDMLIAEVSGIALKTVKSILDEDNYRENNVSIEAMDKGSDSFSDDEKQDFALRTFDSPEEAMEIKERDDHIHDLLEKTLDAKSKKIIDLKLGMSGGQPLTDSEIAKRMNLSPAEVITRYNTAIRVLKREAEADPLLNNQSVKVKRDNYDQVLHFIPVSVSDEDMEDALAFMESVELGIAL